MNIPMKWKLAFLMRLGGSGGCRILGGNDGTLASTTEDLTVGAHQVTLKTASMSTQALTDDSNF